MKNENKSENENGNTKTKTKRKRKKNQKNAFSNNVFETWVWKENGKKMKEEIRKMEVIGRKEKGGRSEKLLKRREKEK